MIERDRFREALAAWASGVAVVACRTERRVVATTVSAFMSLSLERGAVEQGKDTQMFVKITNSRPFAGSAKMRLIGLPPKVTTTELDITKETKEIAFPIKVEPTAPAGIHKNLFCQIVVMENGEPVLHNLGGDEWRQWFDDLARLIVDRQQSAGKEAGSWHPMQPPVSNHEWSAVAGRLYITVMCILILETPSRHAPLYGDSSP